MNKYISIETNVNGTHDVIRTNNEGNIISYTETFLNLGEYASYPICKLEVYVGEYETNTAKEITKLGDNWNTIAYKVA